MQEIAKERWPVLIAIFCFDLVTYALRLGARTAADGFARAPAALAGMLPQLANMAVLYIAIHAINRRSRRASGKIWAACQVHPHARPASGHPACVILQRSKGLGRCRCQPPPGPHAPAVVGAVRAFARVLLHQPGVAACPRGDSRGVGRAHACCQRGQAVHVVAPVYRARCRVRQRPARQLVGTVGGAVRGCVK